MKHEKRVDFCLYMQPCSRADADAISRVVRTAPHAGINHTDYVPLLGCPISLSIETKRTGEDWKEALYQMSIWLVAHQKRLDSLSTPLSSPTFLPGIIIQGYEWYFVAATRGCAREEGGWETVIWNKIHIGSTDQLGGIIQIVTVIQRLAHWSALTYWLWFKEAALQLA